jgi:hypothetical protein
MKTNWTESNSEQITPWFLWITRLFFSALIFALCYPNIQSALAIPAFQKDNAGLLSAQPLPADTAFLIHFQVCLLILSLAIPVLAVSFLFLQSRRASIYIAVVLMIALAQLSFTQRAEMSPGASMIKAMSGPAAINEYFEWTQKTHKAGQ